MGVTIGPILGLAGSQAGEFNAVVKIVTQRRNGGQIARRPIVQTHLGALVFNIKIARLRFFGVIVFPVRPGIVLSRNFIAQAVPHHSGVPDRSFAQAALT